MSADGTAGESRTYGFELPMLLFAGFRSIIDELHAELARRGHPDLRPAHGFALQAIGPGGATATEAGRRLGISKQAAGKTTERLEELGYVYRAGDQADRRRKLIRLSPRGTAALVMSAMIFSDIRSRWESTLGPIGSPRSNRTWAPWRPVRPSASTYPAGSAPSPRTASPRTGALTG
jgi:DNA-binding MarR family transcriptional regulator